MADNPSHHNDPRPLTVRGLVVGLGLATALTATFSWVHANIVVPQILLQTDEMIRKELKEHADQPHRSSVSREELRLLVLDRIGSLATREQVDSIVQRLDALERDLTALKDRR